MIKILIKVTSLPMDYKLTIYISRTEYLCLSTRLDED